MIKKYLYLIKPNIVIGNVISSIGGFLMASQGNITTHHYILLINLIIGIALIVSANCIFNNVIDRDIDAIMQRTQYRILAKQEGNNALFLKKSILYACILGIIGFLFLNFIKNLLIIYLTAIGSIIYIIIYSLWMKRTSIYSIIIGSVSGAIPPVVGYYTFTNKFDLGALILSIIFILWQIPHSYSIFIFRFNDYTLASIPTFPIKKGIKATRYHMIIYILSIIIATGALTLKGYTSYIFLFFISIINFIWLYIGIYQYKSIKNDFLWAKKMFIQSIIFMVSFNTLLFLDCIYLK